ncbi:MAG: PadR family transcriptional regulator, partial [Candidatus Dormibacteraeota bacterium]|nr:PadR family transcriptional regulator [Candidatus Dormibacteraeota bacterium]MBO0762135.1 PadR family transcriptional regulator [Candidatus Dormibacteraeota bacterium]
MKSNPTRTVRRSPLALAVLTLLVEAPSHPYEMQRKLIERGKDEVIDFKPASVYRMVERLEQAGLIEMAGTDREGRRPERTVYRITDEGSETAREWLAEMLSRPAREYPEFPAALSLLPLFEPREAIVHLKGRAAVLSGEAARAEALRQASTEQLPRLFLLELEYQLALVNAELAWVQGLVRDLESGRLTWSRERLVELVGQMPPDLASQLEIGRRLA